MYEDTPNAEYIDQWLEKIRNRYRYEKLKEMSKDRLNGMEYRIDSKFMIFKAGFPDSDSLVQGPMREVAFNDATASKEALTPLEKERLREAESDLKHEIYRAQGHREEKRREHRSELMNSAVDFANAVSRSVLGLWATVKEATPW